MIRIMMIVVGLATAVPAAAQTSNPTRAELLEAGEIYVAIQEARAPWAGKRWERGEDGKVRYEAIWTNDAVWTIAFAIKNKTPGLVAALQGATVADPRVAELEAKLEQIAKIAG